MWSGSPPCVQPTRQLLSLCWSRRTTNAAKMPRTGPLETFWQAVRLADRVVPCHTFNPVGFGPVNSCRLAIPSMKVAVVRPKRSASIAAGSMSGAKLPTSTERCHNRFPSKVRDEKSHIRCRAAQKARSSVERDGRKPAIAKSLPQACTQATIRSHRAGRTSCDQFGVGSRPSAILKGPRPAVSIADRIGRQAGGRGALIVKDAVPETW